MSDAVGMAKQLPFSAGVLCEHHTLRRRNDVKNLVQESARGRCMRNVTYQGATNELLNRFCFSQQ